eukprot:TRINITY_DN27692_c0_g1_i2.p1 TRINITY_DN27692_c0_g1~~TRINITY_DN27692_c0_g1_i2.p1  ORF type:complete len:273 (+),score=38.36 TRINITY_DN27692_c0_g1_i2:222-1040(+)
MSVSAVRSLQARKTHTPEPEREGADHVCRFCLTASGGPFIAPCRCTGSQRWVHPICLLRWRGSSQRKPGTRNTCEVCLTKYRLTAPPAAVGQMLVPTQPLNCADKLQAPVLLVKLGIEAELVELGCVLSSQETKMDVVRLLGGPGGTDWALAKLKRLPLCELPANVQVNGALLHALQARGATPCVPTPCLLSGPASAVLQVCEAALDDQPRILQFVGTHRWPRQRLQDLLDGGTLGVASTSLSELWDDRKHLLETLQKRAHFAAGARARIGG